MKHRAYSYVIIYSCITYFAIEPVILLLLTPVDSQGGLRIFFKKMLGRAALRNLYKGPMIVDNRMGTD